MANTGRELSTERYSFVPGPSPLHIVRTTGRHLITDDGRRILDAGGGAVVANIGYGRSEIAAVAARAMEQITYVLPPWATTARVELLHQVVDEWMPEEITRGGFTSGGSESNETALRLARQHHLSAGRTSKHLAIGRFPSYHGVTIATLGLGGHEDRRRGFETMFPASGHVPWNDAAALEDKILELGPQNVSAFFAEPVVGSSAGVLIASQQYWDEVREICDRYQVLLVLDEVMTGFGRTGTRMGLEHWQIPADIVVGGKGLGGGYVPIGGVFATDAVMAPIAANGDSLMFFTYGAQDVACAVASAVLRTIDTENLLEAVVVQGNKLHARLDAALGNNELVSEIRSLGLMVGVEFASPGAALYQRVVGEALRRNVWIYPANSGPHSPDAIMFGPAFTVTDEEIDTMVSVLVDSLEAASQRLV
ncbi:MAG: aminotransferase class III-fold pyridoxal phosphate-dependent enzyme [Acidimicrobiia bacterium]